MGQSDLGLIQKFKEFFGTYMDSLAVQAHKTQPKQKWDHHRKMVLENSYHLKSKRYTRKELSFLFGLSEERVRQINKETIAALSGRIREVNSDIFTRYYLEDLKNLDLYLQKERVWPKSKFYEFLNTMYLIDIEQERPFINLMIDVLGYKISKNPFSQFKDNDFIFFDETFDRNLFFKICHSIFISLEKNTVPAKLKDIIISVKRDLNQIPKDHLLIEKALNVIGDFEIVTKKNTKLYQVAFHRLSSSADMACRILFEHGNWMKISEINGEIHQRLSLKNKKLIDLKSLYTGMKNDKRLFPLGKSGIWTLVEWGEHDPGMCELIADTLLQINEPLIKEDIFIRIINVQPFIPISLLSLCLNNSKFAQLKDKRIILTEWKDLYKGEIIAKKRNSNTKNEQNHAQIKKQILQLFAANHSDTLPLTNIVNTISQNLKFPKQLIYRRIRADADFKTVKADGQKGKQVIFATLSSQICQITLE